MVDGLDNNIQIDDEKKEDEQPADSVTTQGLQVMACSKLIQDMLKCPGMQKHLQENSYSPEELAGVADVAKDQTLVLFSIQLVANR